jgi:hypothetical protein
MHEGFARLPRVVPAEDALVDEYELLHSPNSTPANEPLSTPRDSDPIIRDLGVSKRLDEPTWPTRYLPA